ncbi:MAG: RagB/SusD family nutrient uptake outer membrane protein [Bacteroidota bacterium]
MKNLAIISLVIIAGLGSYSCEEEILDRTPLDQISDPDFWTSQTDLELYVNQFYDDIDGWDPSGGGLAPTRDMGTDIAYESLNNYSFTYTRQLDGTISIPASGGGWNWSNIRNVNYFLANADRVESGGDLVDQYIGEGHFFRAFYYFDLLRRFGDLPIIKKPVNVDDEDILYGARSSRSEVFDFILEDLDMAISMLKNGPSLANHQSRISKEVAQLFKARLALYEGTWEKYHQGTAFAGDTDGSAYIQEAADAAKAVIDGGNYSLVTGDPNTVYFELFNNTDYAGNPEVLLFRHYNGQEYGNSFSNQLWNWPNGYGWTRDATKFYLCADGDPIGVSPLFVGDDSLEILETNRDPRLAQSVMVPGDPRVINGTDTTLYTIPNLFGAPTGIESQKFRLVVVDPSAGVNNGNVDYINFRFAEALLIYAEARAELGQLTQGDLDLTINQLRDRVGMPHLTMSPTPDPDAIDYGYAISDVLYEIRRERVVELLGEGFRMDDLMRWRAHAYWQGKRFAGVYYTDAMKASVSTIPANGAGFLDPLSNFLTGPNNTYGFDETRDYLLPIPIQELTLNPNLGQNPGW